MTRSFWKLIMLLAVVALVAASGAEAMAIASTPHQARLGAPPQPPAGSSVVGSVAPNTAIKATVALKPRDPAALQQYATAVATPGSSLYHQYLSVAEFRQRFGPTDAQIAAVMSSLRAHGLAPDAVSANGLAIAITSTAGTISHAFSTSFQRLSLPGGRTAVANTQAPLLDTSVAGDVQSILGLSSVAATRPLALRTAHARAHSVRHVATGGPQPCAAASASGSYTADQLAYAYRFSALYGAGDRGTGQTIAIYELEGNFPSDISQDESCYGITTPVSYVKVDGGPPPPSASNGDGLETALDVELAINLAPQAKVIVYQGPNSGSSSPGAGPFDTYNAIISQDQASVISTSWGACEPLVGSGNAQAENTLFQEAAVQGQSIASAAGDAGSTDCTDAFGQPQPSLAVDDPSAQPFVTGVGGTSMSGLGPPPHESVWNDTCPGAFGSTPCGGGGGISQFWRMPSYQSSAPRSLNVINAQSAGSPCGAGGGYCREVPDVSANADPSTGDAVYYAGSWSRIGGTSAAAPLFAALMTLTNASAACAGIPIGFANPLLYSSAAHVYSTDFNDVTAGNNDVTGTHGGVYPAGPVYDMASGLGSPQAAALAANLCAPSVVVGNPGSRRSVIGSRVSLGIQASDSSGYALAYTAGGLPWGLSIDGSTGIISGMPTATGTYSVTVHAVDARRSSGSTSFVWTVDPVTVRVANPGTQRGRAGNKIRLQLRASDNNGGALSYYASGLPQGMSINSSRGLISGKPANGGRFSVTVTARDGNASSSVRFAWIITPSVSGAALTGISKNKPKLSMIVSSEPGSPRLKKIVIALPKPLAFSKSSLAGGISLLGANRKRVKGYKLSLANGKLTITLAKATTQVRLTIKAPSISADARLASAVRHKKSRKLTVTLKSTDASRRTAAVTLKLEPS